MEKILTAAEIVENRIDSGVSVPDLMVEFAKLHVKAALEAAHANSKVKEHNYSIKTQWGETSLELWQVDKDSILNAYPLENIK